MEFRKKEKQHWLTSNVCQTKKKKKVLQQCPTPLQLLPNLPCKTQFINIVGSASRASSRIFLSHRAFREPFGSRHRRPCPKHVVDARIHNLLPAAGPSNGEKLLDPCFFDPYKHPGESFNGMGAGGKFRPGKFNLMINLKRLLTCTSI